MTHRILNRIKRGSIILSLLFTAYLATNAQISHPGNPIGDAEFLDLKPEVFNYTKPPISKSSGNSNIGKNGGAFKFAHQFPTNFTPDNSGVWKNDGAGMNIWYLKISSPGAYSLNIIFDRFRLPEGAKLFLYNGDMSDVMGAFTSKNNKKSGVLPIAPISGDEIIIEYHEPEKVEFKGELLIGAVNHDYVGIKRVIKLKSGEFNESGSCEVDVTCHETYDQIEEMRSVVKYIINGEELCTGTLINNTNNDGKAYVISAGHCLRKDNTANTTLFYFNYETPNCASFLIDGTYEHTISNAEAKVYVEDLDIALMELSVAPPAYFRPYYSGWTLNSSLQPPFYAIHHPQGDVKKISISNLSVIDASFVVGANAPYAQVEKFHWQVKEWDSGATEGGSSGGALFDMNFNLVGMLSGGEAYCGKPFNDYYTQFYKAWDLRSNTNEQFKVWLDPNNTGAQSVDGYDPYKDNGFQRLSNVSYLDRAAVDNLDGSGFLSGHNSNGYTGYAERFEAINKAKLKGVYISVGESKRFSNQTVNVSVWQGANKPETLIYRKENIQLKNLNADSDVFIDFDDELTTDFVEYVNVLGTFYVGYEINYYSQTDSFAVYHNQSDNLKSKNTMLVNDNGFWREANDVYEGGNRTLWIDVLAKEVEFGDTVVGDMDKSQKVIMNNLLNSDKVIINSNKNFIVSCNIYNISGRLVFQKSINRNEERILIDDLVFPNGVYFFKFKLENGNVYTKKVLKITQ